MKRLQVDVYDVLGFVGWGLTSAGVGLRWGLDMGLLAAGGMLLLVSLLGAMRSK